jgi:hypothetical protein
MVGNMNLAQFTSADFKQIVKLLEKKETLQAKVAQIDSALGRFESGEPAPLAQLKRGRKRGQPAKAKRAPRGAVKTAIIDLLKGAGESGITVKDVAAKLGVNYNRVFTWFYNTGKSIKQIKKVAPAKYAWAG